MKTKKGVLTPKQLLFVSEYLIDLNAAHAAIRAGYSKRSAAIIGFENLRKPSIAKAIQAAANERIKRTEIDADYVLEGARELFERCMQREQVMEKVDGKLVPTGEWKFDSSGAGKALKLLGDHVGVNAFKGTDDKGVPIDQNWVTTIVHTDAESYFTGKA